MTQRITQQQLETYLWGAATRLRGLIDAGDYKQFIFPLLFFKRLSDVWDEERDAAIEDVGADFPENHRFTIPDGSHWKDVRETGSNVGQAIQKALRAIEAANPDLLGGIFGDAPWTNRQRLPDATLKDLLEHFSEQTLSIANVPEDELGNAYEFLIKKFADDSGHTAAEFYTNRTVVHLMTQLLDPQAGESIYDPTCGTGGMLISSLAEVKRQGGEYRTLQLYGQERNLITSAIARMNLFLHGVDDFSVLRGDTLAEPRHIENDHLRQFDVILANPPYSIKQWNRTMFEHDPWGRNILGTPPQGRADYAFWQHIFASLTPTGRTAVLWPHGVLFRNEEQAMRVKMLQLDWVEAVIGLGPNLFYNSPMESCIVVSRRAKPAERRGKVLFIDAVNEVTRERAQSFLKPEHQERILNAYRQFTDEPGFARVVSVEDILAGGGNLSIPLYVKRSSTGQNSTEHPTTLKEVWTEWEESGREFWQEMDALVETLDGLLGKPAPEPQKSTVPPAFARAVLAAEIVTQLHDEPTLGSVKMEKLLYLCEKHLGLEEVLQSTYQRQAAGPYDSKAFFGIKQNLERQHWYQMEKGERGWVFTPLEKVGGHRTYFERYFAQQAEDIQNLIDTMRTWKTRDCEIVATLYGAWHDFLQQGIHPSDDELVVEVRDNWHEKKKEIPEFQWRTHLRWMKQNNFVPRGAEVGVV